MPTPEAIGARRRTMAVAGHTADVEGARRGLDDPAGIVRAAALGALERLGALTPDELGAALDDPAATVRRRALAIVATRPGDVAPASLPLLDDADPVVAETAAWAVGERAPAEAGAGAALARIATGHDEHLVREAAIAAIGAVGDPVGLGAVLGAFAERATIRRRAVVALAAFEGAEVDAALERALGDRDRQVRQIAEDLLA